MALIYDPEARAELIDAAGYYEKCRSGLGKAFLSAVERAVARLSNKPLRWRNIGGRFRRCLVKQFPYGIIYAVEGDDIFVAAVMHLKRKPGYWRRRGRRNG
jgi:toxin ParE1/3/4